MSCPYVCSLGFCEAPVGEPNHTNKDWDGRCLGEAACDLLRNLDKEGDDSEEHW